MDGKKGLRFASTKAIVRVCSICIVQDSRLCTAVVNWRVK